MPTHRVRYVAPPGMKFCPECRAFKPKTDFNGGYCRTCYKAYHQRWLDAHEGNAALTIKTTAIRMYGGKCARCGTTDENVLVLYPSGSGGEKALLYELRKQGWPTTHKLLCRNCVVYERKNS